MGLQLQVKTFVPVASSTTALGVAQTVSGAANFTLTSAATSGTYANANTAPKVSFTSSGNISGVNFTVTGTDVNGDAQSEVIAGPNATTVFTTLFYKTVSQVATGASVGTNTSIGHSNHVTGVIFAGRTRVKGMQITTGGTIDTIAFKNTSPAGTTLFSFLVATTTKDYIEPYIPDDGILFNAGAYVDIPAGSAGSATVYYG
tara:strand:+ start:1171 stop:1776 length:606 start_codon:yes stop_codon:yes gene_type:complete